MLVTELGMLTLVSEEQSLKVRSKMLVTELGMLMLVSAEQSSKALLTMLVTPSPMTTSLISAR
jgi:hypothetical protein